MYETGNKLYNEERPNLCKLNGLCKISFVNAETVSVL